jgi:hypothetical protein
MTLIAITTGRTQLGRSGSVGKYDRKFVAASPLGVVAMTVTTTESTPPKK